jgi:hypothetical protein
VSWFFNDALQIFAVPFYDAGLCEAILQSQREQRWVELDLENVK